MTKKTFILWSGVSADENFEPKRLVVVSFKRKNNSEEYEFKLKNICLGRALDVCRTAEPS